MDKQDILNRYLEAKDLEQSAKNARLEVEEELRNAFPAEKLEGTTTFEMPYHKVKIINKLKRDLDHEAYQSIKSDLPFEFVKYEPRVDLKLLREIEERSPEIVAACMTTKPQKPQIKIERIEE